MNNQWNNWLNSQIARIELTLTEALPAVRTEPRRLHQAMAYAVQAGGKRIRPLLVYATSGLNPHINVSSQAIDQAAAAVEMLHTYSLVHDDLPCMDDDDLRRGKPTTHKSFDEATAMLVGDALQTQAFILLSNLEAPAQMKLDLVRELAQASGSLGMAGGQAIDLASVGSSLDQVALENMHRMKTGALLAASIRMGAILAELNQEQKSALDDYAFALGLGFQVVDDVLDATQDSKTLGKTAGKDAQDEKPTFVSLMGLDGASAFARNLNQQALDSLNIWGESADFLREIANWVTSRNH